MTHDTVRRAREDLFYGCPLAGCANPAVLSDPVRLSAGRSSRLQLTSDGPRRYDGRVRSFLCRLVTNHFDIVTVRVEHEGSVVVRMIMRSKTRCPVRASPSGEPGDV